MEIGLRFKLLPLVFARLFGWKELKMSKVNLVCLEKDLINSEVFRNLKKKSLLVYLDFLGKRVIHRPKGTHARDKKTIVNNGKIEFCYTEAKKKGISTSSFVRALNELVEKGFVDITHSGQGFQGDKSTYAVSNRWRKFDTPEFDKKTRPKDNRGGKGFMAYWNKIVRIKDLLIEPTTDDVRPDARKILASCSYDKKVQNKEKYRTNNHT